MLPKTTTSKKEMILTMKKDKHNSTMGLYDINNTDKQDDIKNILILINSSFGEIDWILPVCHYIKKNHPKINLTALFNAIDHSDIIKGNKILGDLLHESLHNCYDFKDFLNGFERWLYETVKKDIYENKKFSKFRPYIKRYFFGLIRIICCDRIVKSTKPNILLKDITKDEDVRKRIITLARKRGCREVMYPHASELYYLYDLKVSPHWYADDILCNSKQMMKMFAEGNDIYQNKKHVVGIPRYDEWWIKHLKSYWKKHDFKKYSSISKKSTIFLLFTQRAHPLSLFSEEIADQLLHEIVSTVLSFQDSFLIIKSHPRQNIDVLKNRLGKYDKSRWIIDQSQAMCLSSIADVLITMGASSVVLDSLAIGKSVIEYYKHTDIKYHDDYMKLELVASAENTSQLKDWIIKIKSNPEKERKIFIDNFRKIVPTSKNNATKKAVKVILGSLGNIRSN